MPLDTWLLFTGAALIVILIPGPLSLLMVSNSINYGMRRALPGFAGGVSASICLLCASALGMGALLTSEQLFSLLKLAGALYLFYLAWQSWRASRHSASAIAGSPAQAKPEWHLMFAKAFGLGASNPKDLLFFAAFLPQFISPALPISGQLAIMVATWAVVDLLCKLLYGLGAQKAAAQLRSGRGQCWFNRLSAALFGSAGAASLLGR